MSFVSFTNEYDTELKVNRSVYVVTRLFSVIVLFRTLFIDERDNRRGSILID